MEARGKGRREEKAKYLPAYLLFFFLLSLNILFSLGFLFLLLRAYNFFDLLPAYFLEMLAFAKGGLWGWEIPFFIKCLYE